VFLREVCQTVLGRGPTSQEQELAAAAFSLGETREQIRAAVMGTDDYFRERCGSSNENFLDALYREALGRFPDGAGRAAFAQALANGASRDQVAYTVFTSAEYQEKLIQGLYQQLLNRAGEATGVNFWVEQLRLGARDEQVITGFCTSSEYLTQRAAAR
jgi:hypothetical protein